MSSTTGEPARADRARTGHYLARGVRGLGGLAWRFDAPGPIFAPCVSAGVVCVQAPDGLRAFDARTGQERWHREGLTDPIVQDGIIYAMRDRAALCLLDAQTGVDLRQWAATPGSTCRAVDGELAFLLRSPDGQEPDTHLAALDLKTGQEKWTFETEEGFPIVSEISFAGNALFFFEMGNSHDGWYVYALDRHTGALLWRHSDMAVGQAAPLVGRRLYFTDNGSHIMGLNLKTGAEEWDYACEDYDGDDEEEPPMGIAYTEAASDGKSLYFRTVSADLLCAVSLQTREQRWAHVPDGGGPEDWPFQAPTLAGGVAYFPYCSTLYALDADTGERLWTFQADDALSSNAIIRDGMLFFTAGQGLYALGETTTETR